MVLIISSQVPVTGCGRMLTLDQAVALSDLVARVKSHLSLTHVRLAMPSTWTKAQSVSTVAACAGSGGQVLRHVQADVYLTGRALDSSLGLSLNTVSLCLQVRWATTMFWTP